MPALRGESYQPMETAGVRLGREPAAAGRDAARSGIRAGAAVIRGETFVRQPESGAEERLIVAAAEGMRRNTNDRLFGFKAHFEGPSTDAVELFFDGQGYVGVSGIEQGLTNVCGIARESLLRRYGFGL